MVGIRSYGGYVPRYRLDRKKIYENIEWISPGNIGLAVGEKAVANFKGRAGKVIFPYFFFQPFSIFLSCHSSRPK